MDAGDEDHDWKSVTAALGRFGLPAGPSDRAAIAAELEEQIRLETEWSGDHLLMRLLCAQLFSLGVAEDATLVWRAKECNFDTHCCIDVTLLCGAGLEETKAFLAATGTADATAALEYVRHCEACGNFDGFTPAAELAGLRNFYQVSP